jgi:hypothetical protein
VRRKMVDAVDGNSEEVILSKSVTPILPSSSYLQNLSERPPCQDIQGNIHGTLCKRTTNTYRPMPPGGPIPFLSRPEGTTLLMLSVPLLCVPCRDKSQMRITDDPVSKTPCSSTWSAEMAAWDHLRG